MNKFIIRWAINGVALYAAVWLIPGIVPQNDNWLAYLWLALIFGLLNALLRPLLKLLTCPLIVLTLGLGTILINMLMLYFAGNIGTYFGVGIQFVNFWAVLLGSLIISFVSIVLSLVFHDELKGHRRRKRKKKR